MTVSPNDMVKIQPVRIPQTPLVRTLYQHRLAPLAQFSQSITLAQSAGVSGQISRRRSPRAGADRGEGAVGFAYCKTKEFEVASNSTVSQVLEWKG